MKTILNLCMEGHYYSGSPFKSRANLYFFQWPDLPHSAHPISSSGVKVFLLRAESPRQKSQYGAGPGLRKNGLKKINIFNFKAFLVKILAHYMLKMRMSLTCKFYLNIFFGLFSNLISHQNTWNFPHYFKFSDESLISFEMGTGGFFKKIKYPVFTFNPGLDPTKGVGVGPFFTLGPDKLLKYMNIFYFF